MEAETAAHKTARERAEKAETQVSMTKLDLKTSKEEASRLQQEAAGLQQKVREGREGKRGSGSLHMDSITLHCSSVPYSCIPFRLRVVDSYRVRQIVRGTKRRRWRNSRYHYITSVTIYRPHCVHKSHDCHMTDLQARERGLMSQVSELTSERHRLEDTIYRLKREAVTSSTSLTEALEQLDKEKTAAVSDVM